MILQYAILVLYFAALVAIGLVAGRRVRDIEDFSSNIHADSPVHAAIFDHGSPDRDVCGGVGPAAAVLGELAPAFALSLVVGFFVSIATKP